MRRNPDKKTDSEEVVENNPDIISELISEINGDTDNNHAEDMVTEPSEEPTGIISTRDLQIQSRQDLVESGELTPTDSETYISEYESKGWEGVDKTLFLSWHQYALQIVKNIEGIWMFEPKPGDCLAMFRCQDGTKFHDIRVRLDLTAEIVDIHNDIDAPFRPDPLSKISKDEIFLINEPPESVEDIVTILGLKPRWEDEACEEGEHDFKYHRLGAGTEVYCSQCDMNTVNLSYRGHNVPWGEARDRDDPTSDTKIIDINPAKSPKIQKENDSD